MHTKLRAFAAAGAAAVAGILMLAVPAYAGSVTTPSSNPFTVPGDTAGTPQSFTITATGYTPGTLVYVEQCDGTPSTAPGWQPTENCDLGTSPAGKIADTNGTVTFTANDANWGFTPFKGLSPQGLFTCGSPTDTNPNDGLPFSKACQVRVSTSNTTVTADQTFFTITLPDAETPPPSTPEAPYAVLLPLGAVAVGGTFLLFRKRRGDGPVAA